MKKLILSAIPVLLTACMHGNFSYEPDPHFEKKGKTVRIAANDKYNRIGNVKRFFLGEHYRKEWETPVHVEVLNLDSLRERLTPVKMGGGMQTKSLRLKNEQGKEYVLRSINKDPSKALPQEFVGTFADDIVQDQISSSNPYAPLVVAELAEAARIFHTTPKIVFVEKANLLGEFNEVFGNTLCLFEERPAGNQEHNPAYGFSKNVINSEKLFEKITEDKDHRVDESAFLRARLFDIWIGDWDRHEDQWVWASFKQNGKTTYKPIPRDRDQAFVKLDGLIPQIAARKWAVRRTQNFDYSIRDVNGLNLSGNAIDRLFTTELTAEKWMQIAGELKHDLTDEKIEKAFMKLPEEIRPISSEEIIQKLKRRRSELHHYALEYYKFLSQTVKIMGSEEREIFEVKRINDDSTSVRLSRVDKNGETGRLVYSRVFYSRETNEIRLYGLGGGDKFELSGSVKNGITVRIIGGDGNDYIKDESHVRGPARKTIVYDQEASVANPYNEAKYLVSFDSVKNEHDRKSFRYDWLAPKLAPGFNPDDGVYIGGGLIFKKYQFGKMPFGYMHSLWGNVAFATGAFNFQYNGRFNEAFGQWNMELLAKVNAPNAVYNFYGMGNETEVGSDDWSYYRVRLNQVIVQPSVQRKYGKHHALNISLKYQSAKVENTDNRFVSSPELDLPPSAFDRDYFIGTEFSYQYNTLDNILYPGKGINAETKVEYTLNPEEASKNFFRLTSEISYFKQFGKITVALRAGGSTIINDAYEFYQAATLGGMDNLRGYRRSRFSGKSALYENTEVRFKLKSYKGYIVRGDYGVLAFFDVGRVWVPEEESNAWHPGTGIGFWFLPYNKISFTATYGFSSESNILNVKAGFLF